MLSVIKWTSTLRQRASKPGKRGKERRREKRKASSREREKKLNKE